MTIKECVALLKEELDIANLYDDEIYLYYINELLQLLYSDIIRAENVSECSSETAEFSLSDAPVSENERSISFESISRLYVNNRLLTKSSISRAGIFPDIFYKIPDEKLSEKISFSSDIAPVYNLKIYYYFRPCIYTKNEEDTNGCLNKIPLPYEWTGLLVSKVKGEICKLANEDSLSAKWLGEFNNLLENFKAWCENHNSTYLK